MPILRYTGTGTGNWRTLAPEESDRKYVAVSGDDRIVDVDEATADALLALDVFEVVDDTDDDGEPEKPNVEDYDNFAELTGVGAATEDNLYDAGYETFDDLRSASDDDLLEIDGIGDAALEDIRDDLDEMADDADESTDATETTDFDVGGG